MSKAGRIRLSSPVLVGRDAELNSLVDLALHPPAVALVEGEAGVGKSRLVDALADHPDLSGVRILVGRCPPLREPFVLGPLVEALRALRDLAPVLSLSPVTAALRPLLPELGHVLPPSEAKTATADLERHLLFRGVREVLEAAGPTVLIVEDLHCSDQTTIELLGFLIEDPPAGLSMVLTCRSEDLVHSPLVQRLSSRSSRVERARLRLEPLPPPDVHTMVRAIVGHDVTDEVSLRVHERSGGLPFAVEEVVRVGQDRGLFDSDSSPSPTALDDLGVPPAVRDSVLERVAALGGDARRVVRAAAVLGVAASEESLARICGLDRSRAATALCQALQAAVLVEADAGRYGFRHPLAMESVYESVPRPKRKELHLKAADELARHRPHPLARLAHHCREAGGTRRWLDYAEAAAEAAAHQGDAAAAVRLLGDALRAPELTKARRARLTTKLGRVALNSGDGTREAVTLLRAVTSDDLRGDVGVDLRVLLAKLLTWTGDAAAGYDELVRCLLDLEGRPGVAAHVMANLAAGPHPSLSVSERLRWLARAEAMAALGHDAPATLEVRGARASVLVQLGDRDGWKAVEELPTDADQRAERLRLVAIWSRLALACAYVGEYRRARSYLERAERWGELYPRLESVHGGVDLVLRWSAGDWKGLDDEARAHAYAHLDLPSAWVPARQIVGSLALAQGDLDGAEQSLAECAERAGPAGLARSLASSSAGLARISLARGDPGQARHSAIRGLEAVTATGAWVWAAELVPTAVEASIACGLRAEAGEVVREFASAVRGRDAPLARASLRTCRALVAEGNGDPIGAVQGFATAERAWATLPRPYEAARSAAQRGQCLLAAGDPSGSDALLDAQTRFAHLGAAGDAQETGRILAGFGIGVPPLDAAGGHGGQLSPRQRQVVDLAAQGLTSTEIADILHISSRTVEDHVAAGVRKLGLSSKRALIGAAGTPKVEQNP